MPWRQIVFYINYQSVVIQNMLCVLLLLFCLSESWVLLTLAFLANVVPDINQPSKQKLYDYGTPVGRICKICHWNGQNWGLEKMCGTEGLRKDVIKELLNYYMQMLLVVEVNKYFRSRFRRPTSSFRFSIRVQVHHNQQPTAITIVLNQMNTSITETHKSGVEVDRQSSIPTTVT